MIKDLSDNHLFNNYPCESEDVKIEALRDQVKMLRDALIYAQTQLPDIIDTRLIDEALSATEPKG